MAPAKSASSGCIRRFSPTRTMATPVVFSVIRFILPLQPSPRVLRLVSSFEARVSTAESAAQARCSRD